MNRFQIAMPAMLPELLQQHAQAGFYVNQLSAPPLPFLLIIANKEDPKLALGSRVRGQWHAQFARFMEKRLKIVKIPATILVRPPLARVHLMGRAHGLLASLAFNRGRKVALS